LDPATIIACAVLIAIDGDTISCDGVTMRPMGDGAPYVSGFDTPEIGRYADCAEEAQLGFLAAARMAELLATPGLIVESSGELDPFDRLLVVLRLPDGSTVGQTLIDEGYAVKWRPRHSHSWCE
jgi:micrococcal nuclease